MKFKSFHLVKVIESDESCYEKGEVKASRAQIGKIAKFYVRFCLRFLKKYSQ